MSRSRREVGQGLLALILLTTLVALCPCVPGSSSEMDCCPPPGRLAVSAMCCPGTGTQTTVVMSGVSLASTAPAAAMPTLIRAVLLDPPSSRTAFARPPAARRILRI